MTLALRRVALSAALAAGSVASGCTVLDTRPDPVNLSQGGSHHCASLAGAYALATSTIQFEITQYFTAVDTDPPYVDTITVNRHPDPKQVYCLDYLSSGFADDTITVKMARVDSTGAAVVDSNRNPVGNWGLLSLVGSHAVDEAAVIIRKLIQTIFVGLSRNATFE